jgi:NAD(P)-dependent dehydrogenase (short-subunit alcohol dehydrogenase family)
MAKRKTSINGIPDPSLPLRTNGLPDLSGKRVAVVGGTDGLGRAIARLAAQRGAEVTVVGRTFRDEGTPGLRFLRADLSSMKEATRVGDELDAATLDVVVLTTGIFAAPAREVTAEGIERDMAVSTLCRHAILKRLAPRLRPRTRVFVMGFPGAGNLGDPTDLNAERRYQAMAAHMNTVAGNEAIVLDARSRHPHLDVFGLNPGLVKTKIRSNFLGEGSLKLRLVEALIGLVTPTPEAYATRVLPLLTAPELAGRSGAMFGKKGTAILPTDGFDAAHGARFIEAMDGLVARALA